VSVIRPRIGPLCKLLYTLSKLSKTTSTQDIDPRSLANNDHPSILPFEMYALEPGEIPSRILKWSPLGFLSQIKRRTIGDRFPLSLWEVWFFSTLGVPRLAHHDLNRRWRKTKGVPIPALIGPPQRCACNGFDYDPYGDHLQTCQVKSMSSQVHECVVYRLGGILNRIAWPQS
jgi:hypothetical protein